ncbi:MAG TPA: S8 family serine peptidase, partial [Planctomycetota bacterium]|nr:S8 family serine peptidase [Planctomycetota bacterium]
MNHRALVAALAGVCLAAATRAQLPATAERSGPAAPERAALNVWLDDGGLGGRTRVALTAAVPAGATMADVEVAKNRVTAAHAAALSAEVVGPFAEAALAAGFEIRALGALAPWVALEGPENPLRTWLAGRREVLVVEAEQFEGGPELDDSVPTVKADWVRTHPTLPMNGAGVKVGVLDSGGVLQANPYLPAGILFNGSPGAQAHSTACAGMVASNHATHTGVAPGVTLLSTGTSSGNSAYLTNGEWCYLNGADLVTCSLFVGSTTTNGLNLSDRGFDYLVRNLGRTFVKSCGNQGNGGYVTSPGRGFNSVAVGNVNDGGTPDWADDVMASSSSGLDPSTGAPKPEVSAPGTSITSTTLSSPWTANVGSGTSYAAPHVAGAAALLMEQAAVLKTRPEAIKALLIATAWHNIEGDRLLSELDGAGAIDCAAAYRTVEAGRFAHGLLTASDFVGGVKDFTFTLKAGNLTRVALSWCSDPADATASYTPDALDATFDVTVHATAGGPALALATHPSASWRILQFTPATSGPYLVRVHQTQWLGTSEPFG